MLELSIVVITFDIENDQWRQLAKSMQYDGLCV